MFLSDIHLKQFRTYQDHRFTFDKNITLITGKNGAGKTNLLEAIYVLLQGTSFRVGDGDLLQTNELWWRLDGTINDEQRQVRYQTEARPAKHLVISETPKRFTYKDRLPVVLFEPNDLQLIHGSPSRRRDALDTMLIALSASYKQALSRYERALQQRNNILKNKSLASVEDLLFSWDVLLSEYGVFIIESRRELIKELNQLLPGYYSTIADRDHELAIAYRSGLPNKLTKTQFIGALHSKLTLDKARGTTSVGPHRDDIEFILNTKPTKENASRGEVRTMILALKIAFARLLEKTYNIKPLILLDDVFSELDEHRQEKLLSVITKNQVIITDTKPATSQYQIRLSL